MAHNIPAAPLATDKQLGFIRSLADEVSTGWTGYLTEVVDDARTGWPVGRSAASKAIGDLLALRAQKVLTSMSVSLAPLDEGMYAKGGEIYKVQKGKQSGNLYAKRLAPIGGKRLVDADESTVHFEFVYEPGAVRNLTTDNRLSLDEAKAFGLRYGVCAVCGARLTDADSVLAGIGPVCASKWS